MKHKDMETKVFKFAIKQLDEDEGRFSGYLSTFNNVDYVGDMVKKGAFKKTLRENKAFPLLWAHSAQEPHLVVGAFHGKEDEKGLLIEGEFFDDDDAQKARQKVKDLYRHGIKVGLSIGYKAIQWKDEEIDQAHVRVLKEIQLFEGSLTLFPANNEARVQAIKEALLELKPYPNNHACVIDDSLEVVGSQTREHNGKKYTVRIGKKPGGGTGERSYLYPKDTWSADEARAHCKSHKGRFEAASGKSLEFRCPSCDETTTIEIPDSKSGIDAIDNREPATAIPGTDPQDGYSANLAALRSLLDGIKSK